MVDCGLYQGARRLEDLNFLPFAFSPQDVKWVVLTHAHIDHIGLTPRLVAEGYGGDIISHVATCDLADIMLRDSAKIQEEDAAWAEKKWRQAGRKAPPPPRPLYTVADAERATTRLRGVPYDEVIELSPEVRLRFIDAGHILGSATLEVSLKAGDSAVRLTFSGDIGSRNSLLLRDPQPPGACDFLVMESTYGDRNHEAAAERADRLCGTVSQVATRQGCVIIPAFSVGRTQELLFTLNDLHNRHCLPPLATYVDSPLAIGATRIFRKHPECYKRELLELIASGDDPFEFPNLHFTQTVEESKAINRAPRPYIVISAAGMCNAGRIRHHLANHLGESRDLVLFVGYQGENTLGRQIRDGAPTVRLLGQRFSVKAQVDAIDGFSAHADRDGLLGWFGAIPSPPGFTLLTHGEPEASFALRDTIRAQFSAQALVPELGDVVDLVPGNPRLTQIVRQQDHRAPGSELAPKPEPQEVEDQ
jgi:metallo-beta-lactamase family protein